MEQINSVSMGAHGLLRKALYLKENRSHKEAVEVEYLADEKNSTFSFVALNAVYSMEINNAIIEHNGLYEISKKIVYKDSNLDMDFLTLVNSVLK